MPQVHGFSPADAHKNTSKDCDKRIKLSDGQVVNEIGEESYKYMGTVEYNKIMEDRTKEAFQKEYLRRNRLVPHSKQNGLNKIKAINTWATSLIRYGGGIIARRNNKLKSLDQRTRKLMTMNKELNPKAVCKQEGRWKGLIQVLRAVLGLKKIVLLGI